MAKEKLTERVGFRLRGEEFKQIVRVATGKDLSPDDWCREVVREKLATIRAQASGVSASSPAPAPADRAGNQTQEELPVRKVEFALVRESIRVRWLLQEFLSYCARETLTPEACRRLIDQVNKPDRSVDELAKKFLVAYGIWKPGPTD